MKRSAVNRFSVMLLLILFVTSCVLHHDIAGVYRMQYFPKTILRINADSTFEFVKIIRNPYLLPYDHASENYFVTRGVWHKKVDKILSITSQKDSLAYPLSSMKIFPPRDSAISYFTFFDIYSDTVRILYVNLSDGSSLMEMHSSTPFFEEDLRKTDTLEFHFYGYRPLTLISGQKVNHDYSIMLKPTFQPGFFLGREFKIKRKRLIDIVRHVKFNRSKNKDRLPELL